jgi:hypothetical protein
MKNNLFLVLGMLALMSGCSLSNSSSSSSSSSASSSGGKQSLGMDTYTDSLNKISPNLKLKLKTMDQWTLWSTNGDTTATAT